MMQCYHSLSIMVSTERVTLSVVHLSPSAFWHLRFVQLIISPMNESFLTAHKHLKQKWQPVTIMHGTDMASQYLYRPLLYPFTWVESLLHGLHELHKLPVTCSAGFLVEGTSGLQGEGNI